MKKLIKYNLEIMSGILLLFCIITLIFFGQMSFIRRASAGFMLLYMLHEWEESRIPGGFNDLFFGRFHLEPKADQNLIHIPVAVTVLLITILPFIFDKAVVLFIVPLVLALFEGFVHTFGIILMKQKKPYTPGMLTAWLMFAYAIYIITCLNAQSMTTPLIWIIGILLEIVSFIFMQRLVIKTAGFRYSDMFTAAKKYILKR